jgi:hypothetical protein
MAFVWYSSRSRSHTMHCPLATRTERNGSSRQSTSCSPEVRHRQTDVSLEAYIAQPKDDYFPGAVLIEYTRRVGDCLFACLAVWLNARTECSTHTASTTRLLAASEVDADNFEHVLYDIATWDGAEVDAADITPRQLAVAIAEPGGIWGSHSTLVLVLRALCRLAGGPAGALVISGELSEPRLVASEDAWPRYCAVLDDVDGNHYRLVGASSPSGPLPSLVFDFGLKAFVRDGNCGAEPTVSVCASSPGA